MINVWLMPQDIHIFCDQLTQCENGTIVLLCKVGTEATTELRFTREEYDFYGVWSK